VSGEPAATDAQHRAGPGHQAGAEPGGDEGEPAATAPGAPEAPPADQPGPEGTTAPTDLSVEDLLTLVETLTVERDRSHQERDASVEARARVQAEFENYRKRVAKQEAEQVARAADALVTKLLPTLDAFEAALGHDVEGVEPIWNTMWAILEREGMEKLTPVGEPFDPTHHEAVAHEPGEGGAPQVSEVLRSGWVWKGRVLRPAMVKVRD
jgi:molecular chaperone GrpE